MVVFLKIRNYPFLAMIKIIFFVNILFQNVSSLYILDSCNINIRFITCLIRYLFTTAKAIHNENVLMHVMLYGKHFICVLSLNFHSVPIGHVLLLSHFVVLVNKITFRQPDKIIKWQEMDVILNSSLSNTIHNHTQPRDRHRAWYTWTPGVLGFAFLPSLFT